MRALLTVLLVALLATPAVAQEDWSGKTVVITGANRGLGLEFARQLHAAGANVIGTARRPEAADDLKALGVRVEQLDVTDPESVANLKAAIGDAPVDALLNNAGIFPSRVGVEQADPADYARVYDVNVIGPLRVTQALLPNLRAGERKLIMNMSSGLGSISSNGRGGSAGYRESKSALNMMTKSMAAEFDGFICIAMSPGWVRTDMGGPNANLSPEQSVSGMLGVLAAATVDDSGSYFTYDGQELGW